MATKTLNSIIFASDAPWDNPFQGKDKKVLFVCSAGILRSATGARIYAKKYNTRACGSESYALIPISDNLIAWANEIVFVQKENYNWVNTRYNLEEIGTHKKIVVLNIPDMYEHMHPKLIEAFTHQYETP